jgi:hypothetical protein
LHTTRGHHTTRCSTPQMLASTIQFSNNNPHRPHTRPKPAGTGTQENRSGTDCPRTQQRTNRTPPTKDRARGRAPAPAARPLPAPRTHRTPPQKRGAATRGDVLRAHPQGPQRPSHPIPTFHPRAPATGHPPAQRAPNPPPQHPHTRAPAGREGAP